MNIIYTVLTGGTDDLKEPLVKTPFWDYLCFTNNPNLVSKAWTIIPMSKEGGARMLAKHYKFAFPFHMLNAIYLDASFYINCDLNVFWERHFVPGKLCTMQHPTHNDPYTEIDNVLNTGRDTLENCNRVRSIFESEGIKPNSGMVASGIILRDGSEQVNKFCEEWFNTYLTTGPRDQLAWARVNHKHPEVTHRFKYDYRNETSFLHVPHLDNPRKRAAKLAYYASHGIIK